LDRRGRCSDKLLITSPFDRRTEIRGSFFGGDCVGDLLFLSRQECRDSCERTYMKSTSESLSHPETSNGRAAGGNCVVVRRGGERPEADLQSQTQVNPIRFATTASLRVIGEACRVSGNRFRPHLSSTGEKRVVGDGWGENAGKISCERVEICSGGNPCERSRAEVRAAIVVMKRGNARGVKGGKKVERQKP
jgi:hypothetical protein